MYNFHISGKEAEILRKHFRLSRKAVSVQLECSPSTIGNWEKKSIVNPVYNEFIIDLLEPNISLENFEEFVKTIETAQERDKKRENQNRISQKDEEQYPEFNWKYSLLRPILSLPDIQFNLMDLYVHTKLIYGEVPSSLVYYSLLTLMDLDIIISDGPDTGMDNHTIFPYGIKEEVKELVSNMFEAGCNDEEIVDYFILKQEQKVRKPK